MLAGKDIGKPRHDHARHPRADKVIVDGVNIVKRHTKPTGRSMQGGIIDKEMPIHVSNVGARGASKCGATRIGYRFDDDGEKHPHLPQVRG